MKKSFNKVLVLGAGPVVIGQSSEFDYTGTQICRTLKQHNIKTVVVNPNPATVMTDKHYADAVYLEPLQAEVLKKIIETEKPDAILAAASGKKGLELCLEMAQTDDFLDLNVSLLDVQPDVVQNFASRRSFNRLLADCNLSGLEEEVVSSLSDATIFAETYGYPVSLRAAFTADAKQYVTCSSSSELLRLYEEVSAQSVLGQVAIQKCITGFTEIDIQCIRDAVGDFKIVSSTEYIEKIGIHSADSVAVLPAKSLKNDQMEKLYGITKTIAEKVSLCGTCLVRFAIAPNQQEIIVFGAETAFSRSTALSEKASHFPLSIVTTEIALGYSLAEMDAIRPFSKLTENENTCVRIPKWSFENFGENAFRQLGDVMKSVGEVYGFGNDFATAFYKALLSLNLKKSTKEYIENLENDTILHLLKDADDLRVFLLLEALRRDISPIEISKLTKIDLPFLKEMQGILKENFSKTIHTPIVESTGSHSKEKVLVIGAGPTSIGLGTDRDFALTLCLKALSDFDKETVSLNTNPSANSTSSFAADKAYVEPILDKYVEEIVKTEKIDSAILAFGGGHVIRRTQILKDLGVKIYGPDVDTHNTLKNKLAFADLLDSLQIRRVDSKKELVGRGAHVDILCDGENIFIPGICEHMEKAKVHSGDSLAVYPCMSFEKAVKDEIVLFAQKLCTALKVKGLLSMQFVVFDHAVYVRSASVVATRNIPFMTKATGLPIMEISTRLMLGETLQDIGIGTGLYKEPEKVFVRVPVFSFERLEQIDVRLGATMRSTGEVIGVGDTYDEALYKGFLASGMRLKRTGGVMISVADSDKPTSVSVGEAFLRLGFKIYATANTAKLLNVNHIATNAVRKIHEGEPNTLDLILKNKLSYLVSTAQETSSPNRDDVTIRRTALLRRIPVLPSVEMALALTDCLEKNTGLEEIKITKL